MDWNKIPTSYYLIDDGLYQSGLPDENMPKGIEGVLSLLSKADSCWDKLEGHEVDMWVWLPIADAYFPGLPWLETAVGMIEAMRKSNRKVLIHCMGGISRSAMVTAAYLMKIYGWDRDTALEVIASENPKIDPNPSFMWGLKEWELELKRK